MTPLQVILLGKRMRDAQRAFNQPCDNLGQRLHDMSELEEAFDKAIEPYINHARNEEISDGN